MHSAFFTHCGLANLNLPAYYKFTGLFDRIYRVVIHLKRVGRMKEFAMKTYGRSLTIVVAVLLTVFALKPGVVCGEEKSGIEGWEKDSAYNKHYNLDEWDSFKGVTVGFQKVTPLPGMSPGIALLVEDRDSNEVVTVHLGPSSFVNPNSISLKKGDRVNVKGVWAEMGGQEVFMAAKIKKGDYYEYKVRLTKDGTPFWTMSAEELAKERQGN